MARPIDRIKGLHDFSRYGALWSTSEDIVLIHINNPNSYVEAAEYEPLFLQTPRYVLCLELIVEVGRKMYRGTLDRG